MVTKKYILEKPKKWFLPNYWLRNTFVNKKDSVNPAAGYVYPTMPYLHQTADTKGIAGTGTKLSSVITSPYLKKENKLAALGALKFLITK